ncbi:hypothetical protein CR513_07640, partial [Mucuna pruriens]
MSIFQANKPCGWIYEVSLRISDGSLNEMNVHGSIIVIVFNCSWMHPSNGCNASILINMNVGIVSKNNFTSSYVTVHKHRYKVGHSA